MWGWASSRKLHWSSSYFSSSSLAFILLTPLLLISVIGIACSQKSVVPSTFSWKSLGSSVNTQYSNNLSDAAIILGGSISSSHSQLLKSSLSSSPNAERRGFVNSGLHRRYSRLEKNEAVLARARVSIREAAKKRSTIRINNTNSNSNIVEQEQEQEQDEDDESYVPHGPIYRNANAFYRSYIEMENVLKIYVYEEGEAPMFHNGPCRSIYSTEGWFIYELERGSSSSSNPSRFRTRDPEEAHVFFMPFSVVAMVQYLYEPGSLDMDAIGNTIADYVHTISRNHPFWNRSQGADHFMLSCHDWGPHSTSYAPLLYNNSIRVLCNANTSEGFNPLKDATLPEINLKTGDLTGLLGGSPPHQRSILAFFAGGLHGHIRHLLLDHWGPPKLDPDVQVYQKLPANLSYTYTYEEMLRNSKFCLCPSGYEVASPRVVEAIYAGCVPVLISDSYLPPFSDVLNWKKFSVAVDVKDIPKIKEILMGISEAKYLKLQNRVRQVQRHFLVNQTPKRFDLFHMILHSVWLRRLNFKLNYLD